jgi:hypothetical protein
MLKIISSIVFALLLAGCGGTQQTISGVNEPTKLLMRSEALVGMTVSVGDEFSLTVSEEDLTPFQMGLSGARDTENETLETLVFEVKTGKSRVTVEDGRTTIFDKYIYFGKGQTRVVRIRK